MRLATFGLVCTTPANMRLIAPRDIRETCSVRSANVDTLFAFKDFEADIQVMSTTKISDTRLFCAPVRVVPMRIEAKCLRYICIPTEAAVRRICCAKK